MYQETKNINWGSLFIKVIIFVVIGLLAIGLVSAVIKKISNDSFEENINILKDASIEYFKKGNLPGEEGETSEVTLGDLIKMKYINSFDKKCNREKSYSQATLVDDYYALRVELVCDSKKDYIYTSLDKAVVCPDGNCEAPSVEDVEVYEPEEFEQIPEAEGSGDEGDSGSASEGNSSSGGSSSGGSSSGGSSSGGSSSGGGSSSSGGSSSGSGSSGSSSGGSSSGGSNTNKVLYYQYVKQNKVYSDWTFTKPSGSNYETKIVDATYYKYCPVVKKDYYAVGSINKSDAAVDKRYRFRIRFNDVPTSATKRTITKYEFFDNNTTMYQNAVSNYQKIKFIEGSDGLSVTKNVSTIKNASLKSSNLIYVRSLISEASGYIYNESTVEIDNLNSISSYSNKYFVPMHITFQYTDNGSCKTDLHTNASKYKGWDLTNTTVSKANMYRTYEMKNDYNDIQWSTSSSLKGYVQTGKTEYRAK